MADFVRHFISAPHPAGDSSQLWPAKDDDGREVAAGVYVARVETGGKVSSGRLVLTK